METNFQHNVQHFITHTSINPLKHETLNRNKFSSNCKENKASVSITETELVNAVGEIITVYSEKRIKLINALCAK